MTSLRLRIYPCRTRSSAGTTGGRTYDPLLSDNRMVSEAQRRARAEFVRRFGGRKKGKPKTMAKRTRTPRTSRRRPGKPVHHGLAVAGGALTAYGLVGPKQPGWTWDADPRTSETMADRIHNVTQSIPLYGTDPNMAPARATVATGVAAVVVSKAVGHFFPSLKKSWTGKKTRVSLAG